MGRAQLVWAWQEFAELATAGRWAGLDSARRGWKKLDSAGHVWIGLGSADLSWARPGWAQLERLPVG